jgi:hypothetical protein
MIVANDDASGMDNETEKQCREGIAAVEAEFEGYLVCNYNDDDKNFDSRPCEVCKSHLAGSRHHMAVLVRVN